MDQSVETISPAKAQRYLETRAANRNLSDSRVLEYALAIEAGGWVLNGESIKFDANGRLFDGQHRLAACVLAEKPFTTLVVRGVDDERAMATVDTGKMRSHTDVWTIAGHKNAALTSSIAMMVMLYEQNRISWHGFVPRKVSRSSPLAAQMKKQPLAGSYVSKEELLAYGEANIVRLSEAATAVHASPSTRIISPQAAGTFFYFAATKDRAGAEGFLQDVGKGAGLQLGDPALTFREHIITRTTKTGARLHRAYQLGMLIKAWNARRDGKLVKVLRIGEDEPYPKVR